LPLVLFILLPLVSWSINYDFRSFEHRPVIIIILLIDLTLFWFFGSWPLSVAWTIVVLRFWLQLWFWRGLHSVTFCSPSRNFG
jgi:hypothetical protein